MTKVNRRITLASRPVGYPKVSDFHMVFIPVPAPGAGEVLVRSVYLFQGELGELCPAGVDIYFDNAGGATTDAVVQRLNPHARIAVCGQVSQYNLELPEVGPRWLSQLMVKQAKVQGFLVSSFARRFPEGCAQLASWLKSGELKYREDVAVGIESAPQAFIGMLHGRNQGKQLVQISEL